VFDEVSALRRSAKSAAARGDAGGAVAALLSAAAYTHLNQRDYAVVLHSLEEMLAKQGDVRGALTVACYLGQGDPSAWERVHSFMPVVPPIDRAMAAAAQGRMAEAALEMEGSGRLAAAAIFREKAGDWRAARALWSRLTQSGERGDAYVGALARFNLARCARRCDDTTQSRDAMVASVRLLEEAADHFELIGQRERAFDCFQVLVDVGRESGAFEDVLEGFVNCIRILREDNLKQFALEYFDAAIAAAEQRGEMSAAAIFAREAAEYARTLGLASAASYVVRQAELWRASGRQLLERGAHPEAVARALLSALLAYGEVGQYSKVSELYAELALLELERPRREHYARAATRYAGVKDQVIRASGTTARELRLGASVSDIWHVDLLEWEERGSAAEACAGVMLDGRWLELTRRRALVARLTALRVETQKGRDTAAELNLVKQLAHLQHYAVLAPLEQMFARGKAPIRLAVLDALQILFYKRTFVTVRAALREGDPALVTQAAKTIAALRFPHAFDPLARIFRESPVRDVRASALWALAHVDTSEATEFLIGVLHHGAPEDRVATLDTLRKEGGAKWVELARSAEPGSSGVLQESLRVLRALQGVESEHAQGKIGSADYEQRSAELLEEARRIR
jgi:hypothetical protein